MDPDANGHARYTLIRDLPATERPRERLRDNGPGSLSNAELLAILLRTGSSKESALAQATRILAQFAGLAGLRRANFRELCAVHGLGEAKAAQVHAALELGVRLASVGPDERPIVRTPEDVANLLLADMSSLEQESVRVVMLDARNHVLGTPEIYRGSVHTAHVRIGELMRDPVRTNAAAFVLVHNHPSGDPTPSAADIAMTKQIVEAARMLDIDLHDHLVIGGGRYVSMRTLRLGFPADGR